MNTLFSTLIWLFVCSNIFSQTVDEFIDNPSDFTIVKNNVLLDENASLFPQDPKMGELNYSDISNHIKYNIPLKCKYLFCEISSINYSILSKYDAIRGGFYVHLDNVFLLSYVNLDFISIEKHGLEIFPQYIFIPIKDKYTYEYIESNKQYCFVIFAFKPNGFIKSKSLVGEEQNKINTDSSFLVLVNTDGKILYKQEYKRITN